MEDLRLGEGDVEGDPRGAPEVPEEPRRLRVAVKGILGLSVGDVEEGRPHLRGDDGGPGLPQHRLIGRVSERARDRRRRAVRREQGPVPGAEPVGHRGLAPVGVGQGKPSGAGEGRG